ncbi:hypothetical protein TGP89_311210 [Toxoplasma gondii p89]|uniref:Transmembrane protein n=1 Tax=Toxoplasma gondii p89 TaxID=943119 RepID=A0A086K9P0_TOXGO|nr:hypothetical protein TGP89_311210 [Toxoplasma gondii p89]
MESFPCGSSPEGVPPPATTVCMRRPRRRSLLSGLTALALLFQSLSSLDVAFRSPLCASVFSTPSLSIVSVSRDLKISASSPTARSALSWPFSFLGVEASLNLHPSVSDYVIAAVRDRLMVDHDQLLPKRVALPVCDSLSGPVCPHLSAPRVVRLSPPLGSPQLPDSAGSSGDSVFVAAPSTSPAGEASPQNPDFYYAYVHRFPVLLSASSPSFPSPLPPRPLSASPGSDTAPKNDALPRPGAASSVASSLSSLTASFLSFVSSLFSEESSASAAAAAPEPLDETHAARAPVEPASAVVDWRFSFIARERPEFSSRASKHHPERVYSTRGAFLENAVGDVSSSSTVSEAIASAIGQIGLGRKALDDIWLTAPLGSFPPERALSSRSHASNILAHSSSSGRLSHVRDAELGGRFAFPDSARDPQRFVCFTKKRGRHDHSACALASEFPELPASLVPTVEPFPRSWIATSHLLTFEKSTAPFAQPFLESDFDAGLPTDAETRWEGLWEVLPVSFEEESSSSQAHPPGGQPPRAASPDWRDVGGSPATIPSSPPRFYGRGDPTLLQEGGSSTARTDAIPHGSFSSPPSPSLSSSLPLPRRRRPPQAFSTVAVLSTGEGMFEHGTSFVVSSIWAKALRNGSESLALRRLLPRVAFVVSGLHEGKEVFSAQIPLAFLASRTDLALPLAEGASPPPAESEELAFVNLLDFLPFSETPWTRVDSLKFRYVLKPPTVSVSERPSDRGLPAPRAHTSPSSPAGSLEPLLASTVSQLAYKVGIGGLVLHVAQRSSGMRTVYYVDRRSPEGVALLRVFEEKEKPHAEPSGNRESRGGRVGKEENSTAESTEQGQVDSSSLLLGDSGGETALRGVGEDGGGATVGGEAGGRKGERINLAGNAEREVNFPARTARNKLTREKIKRAIRNVVLDVLRNAVDPKVYRRVLSAMPPLSPQVSRKLEPLKTLAARLPFALGTGEDEDEAEDGLLYAAVLRTHGDGSGEFLWHQVGDSSSGAAALADEARRQSREARERNAELQTDKEEGRNGESEQPQTEKEKAEKMTSEKEKDVRLFRVGGDSGKVVLTAGLNSSVGTTGGSNRRLPLAKYDNLNNSLVDLRLPARSVGVYIQEVPVEAPLLSFNEADGLDLVLWRRVGFDTEGKYRDAAANVRGSLFADVKNAVSQVLESLGGKSKQAPRAAPDSHSKTPLKPEKGDKGSEKESKTDSGEARETESQAEGGQGETMSPGSVNGVIDTILSLYASLNEGITELEQTAALASLPPASASSAPALNSEEKREEDEDRVPRDSVPPAVSEAKAGSPPLSPAGSTTTHANASVVRQPQTQAASARQGSGIAPSTSGPERGLASLLDLLSPLEGDLRAEGSAPSQIPSTPAAGANAAAAAHRHPRPRSPDVPVPLTRGHSEQAGADGTFPEVYSFSLSDLLNKATKPKSSETSQKDDKGTTKEDALTEKEKEKKEGSTSGKGAKEQPFAMGFVLGPDNQLRPLNLGQDGSSLLGGVGATNEFREMLQSVLRDVNIPEMAANLAQQFGGAQAPRELSIAQAAQVLASHLENREGISEQTAGLGKFAAMFASQMEAAGSSSDPSKDADKDGKEAANKVPSTSTKSPQVSLSAISRVAQQLASELLSKPPRDLKQDRPKAEGRRKSEERAMSQEKSKKDGVSASSPGEAFAFSGAFSPGQTPGPGSDVSQIQAVFQAFLGNGDARSNTLADLLTQAPAQGSQDGAESAENGRSGNFQFAHLAQDVLGRVAEPGGPPLLDFLNGGSLNLSDLFGQLGRANETDEAKRKSKSHPKYRSAKQKRHKIRETGEEHDE